MFRTILLFELRYQFRNPLFWVATILFFLLTLGATSVESIRLGSGGNIHTNAPTAIAQVQLVMSLFFMFVTTAFVGNVVVRDDQTGFGGIVRSTKIGKISYMLGRFSGALLGAAIAFLAVPLAIWIGTLMPWVDPERLGPDRLSAYLVGYLFLGLPNVLTTSAFFFAVACWTRSVTYSYLTAILFAVAYSALTVMMTKWPELSLAALFEPFGTVAFGLGIRYLTPIQANTQSLDLTALLLGNRALWLAISLGVVAFAVSRFRFAENGISARGRKRQESRNHTLAAIEPVIIDRLPDRDPGSWHQLRIATSMEVKLVSRSPAFWILAIFGTLNLLGTLNLAGRFYGVPILPRTFAIVDTVTAASAMITLLMAIYFSGEVVWRERERRFSDIVDATPVPNWIFLLSKLSGVTAALLVLSVAAVLLVSILFQLSRGVTDIEPWRWFAWFVAPSALYVFQIAVLAVVVQALSPNKFVGWAIMLLYLVAGIVVTGTRLDHPLINFADAPMPLSDMNGADYGGAISWWLRSYWTAFALVLIVIGHVIWRRGTAVTNIGQWRTLPTRLRGKPLAFLIAAVTLSTGIGGYLFYNIGILNHVESSGDTNRRLALYEQRYAGFVGLPQPTLTRVRLKVDLYPSRGAVLINGTYDFANATGVAIQTLHVRTMPGTDLALDAVSVPGAKLIHDDDENHYRIYRFAKPLQPGARDTLSFRTEIAKHGLAALPRDPQAYESDAQPAANGTYLMNHQMLPLLGMDRTGFLAGKTLRQEHGLEADVPTPKLEDTAAQARNYADMERVDTDITVTTDADQTLVATGARVSDTVANGRRTARFVSPVPSFNFITIQSARYDVKTADAGGVKLEIYHHPGHSVNVDRMARVMQESLDYYRRNFGPYQYRYARIVERPGYGGGANSAAGTIGYSEKVGFVMDLGDPKRLDFLAYLTAHELAHQYWFHQLMPADMQGAELMTEGLAQYSALMVMKQRYGEDQVRVFLKYELDQYLQGRRTATADENPLARTSSQGYIHYNKASIVMYLLQDRLGVDRVNAMLRHLLDRYRFKPAPYARSTDLVNGFLSLARNEGERQLINDQFHRITLYDLKMREAVVRRLGSGQYETTMIVEAAKTYADGKGNERKAAFGEQVDVGVFTVRPGESGYDRSSIGAIRRVPLRSGEQKVRIVTRHKPIYAGVDPYIAFIDRNVSDNITAIADRIPASTINQREESR